MKQLVIFGAEVFADIAHYYFRNESDYRPVAFSVDGAFLKETTFQGLPVVAFEELAATFPPDSCHMFVAVGVRQVNQFRARKVAEAEGKGYRLASLLSPRAWVWPDFQLRPNTIIMEYSMIQPGVEIGCDTVVWAASRIGFRARIGDHCWIACPLVADMAVVGDYSFVGPASFVGNGVTVGKSNIIGAGAMILKDTRDNEVYKGPESAPLRVPSQRLWGFGR